MGASSVSIWNSASQCRRSVFDPLRLCGVAVSFVDAYRSAAGSVSEFSACSRTLLRTHPTVPTRSGQFTAPERVISNTICLSNSRNSSSLSGPIVSSKSGVVAMALVVASAHCRSAALLWDRANNALPPHHMVITKIAMPIRRKVRSRGIVGVYRRRPLQPAHVQHGRLSRLGETRTSSPNEHRGRPKRVFLCQWLSIPSK